MITTKRPYPLYDEIKMHVVTWSADSDWKTLPPTIKAAATTLLNEITIADQLQQYAPSELAAPPNAMSEKKRFIAIFRQRYNEYCGFANNDTFGPTEQFIVGELITRLKQEGSGVVDYLKWFFDDFMRDEYNKTRYAPPSLHIVTKGFVVDKYLFQNKDSLRVRKQDVINASVKNALIKLATDYLKESKDRDFGQKALAYNRGELTLKKFSDLFVSTLDKRGDTTRLSELQGIIGAKNG